MPPALSIIIITYNSRGDIARCLASLQQFCRGVAYEIIVCDNASADGSAELIAREFPFVKLLRLPENRGFGAANNAAVQMAQGRYLLLLNPDTWVDDDLAAALAGFLDANPAAAGCVPKHLNPDGSIQIGAVRELPTLATLFYERSGLARLFPKSRRFGRYRMTWWDHNEQRPVPQAGACLALRREVFQAAGGFDEGYFMYFEDVELCHNVAAAGGKLYYLPAVRVYHVGGQSAKQAVAHNFLAFYRSLCRYFRKHHGPKQVLIAKLIVGFSELATLLLLSLALPFDRLLPAPQSWRSRRAQWCGHALLLLRLWSF
ncbi:MAG: glycosyltransferase family 2 protein [candidate division KSB1 bacterium]|nr:glycosyltransferase family 2 protein [candidate division KSB1 bacterium]MDZ7272600.1 glycosyltransferase family 2 protein [candidate division KSB1 bacterium]MDZ7284377.1 glycosyltransferase family 2 protein [candidate division KSB1 bacterium]MDZ7297227.1 glycosyltransferase family 2 protein [candidate division KSB1 bacterium]MDZ7308546.1 glycosyltransferase family 2 protein [candidate division KSB1 bacterium]